MNMVLKINKFFLLIILILLQSCSGGRIGNFLESSFENIEEPKTIEEINKNLDNKKVKNSEGNFEKNQNIEELKIKEKINKNLKNKIVKNSEGNVEQKQNIEEPKIKEKINKNLENNIVKKSDEKSKYTKKITKKNKLLQKIKYQPESYKIIFILKNVDPKDPTEELRTILRNSDVNFEIEKIERYFEPKNKSVKSN